MSDDTMFTIDDANAAQKALRDAAGLGPARFPIPAVVGMLGDEIEALRSAGRSDADIAAIITKASGKPIEPAAIDAHHTPPSKR